MSMIMKACGYITAKTWINVFFSSHTRDFFAFYFRSFLVHVSQQEPPQKNLVQGPLRMNLFAQISVFRRRQRYLANPLKCLHLFLSALQKYRVGILLFLFSRTQYICEKLETAFEQREHQRDAAKTFQV